MMEPVNIFDAEVQKYISVNYVVTENDWTNYVMPLKKHVTGIKYLELKDLPDTEWHRKYFMENSSYKMLIPAYDDIKPNLYGGYSSTHHTRLSFEVSRCSIEKGDPPGKVCASPEEIDEYISTIVVYSMVIHENIDYTKYLERPTKFDSS